MAISVEHRSKFAALTGNGDLPSEKFSSGMISPKQNYVFRSEIGFYV